MASGGPNSSPPQRLRGGYWEGEAEAEEHSVRMGDSGHKNEGMGWGFQPKHEKTIFHHEVLEDVVQRGS